MLTARRLDHYAADDQTGAIGRLVDRCDRQAAEIHGLTRQLRQLRAELARERRANTLLRARLARQRTRRRYRAAEQLSITLEINEDGDSSHAA